MTVRAKLAIGVVSVAVLSILVYAARVIRSFPESHARSCLVTITELADRTIEQDIPQERFHDAVAAAKYIKWYYPPGAVLPEDHPFAAKHQAERQTQIRRIREALQEATGDGHATIWREWTSEIEENDAGTTQ